ncbi:MAG: hypothetical protein IJ268_07895 [Proteobacteria bacterium]|nr:hypothetical protein [Pseudomonadota bacterium]
MKSKYYMLAALVPLLVLGCSEEPKNTQTAANHQTLPSEPTEPKQEQPDPTQEQPDPTQEPTDPKQEQPAPTQEPSEPTQPISDSNAQNEAMLSAKIDETPVNIQWEDNESVRALKAMAQKSPISVSMSQYGGFEQVGALGTTLPRNDAQTTTAPGDIVLYSGNQIVVFYGSNSWAYTRLGKITDKSEDDLKALLDKDHVTLSLSDSDTQAQDTQPAQDKKQLVAYFSVTGHTKPIAEYISEHTGATLYEIVPETPYTDADINYGDNSSRTSIEQNDDHARPGIASTIDHIEQYDIIYLGYPIWWGQAPKIMYTFLESASLKTSSKIVPFCTSASSPMGTSATNLKASAPAATWLEGHRFAIGTDRSTVTSWVDSLPLK